MERLDKIISIALGISRTDAKKLILKKAVTVNGNTVNDISFKASTENDVFSVNGKRAVYKEHIYIIMNKPDGVISAGNDKKCQTVIDIIPESLKRKGLFPVGRLDKTTTGLLIITDDGDFAHKLLSPSHKIPKKYVATLDAPVTKNVIECFKSGVTLADGTKVAPAELDVIGENTALVTITEGKYHQIKRMFGVFDIGVDALERVSFAGLELPYDLKKGCSREIMENEIKCIKAQYFL